MKEKSVYFALFVFLVLFCAANPVARDTIDKKSTDLIKEYTTKPEFLSPIVDFIPESETVPSPRDFLGYVVGAPKKLTHARNIHRYFYELAKSSDRINVFELGKSNEGRSRILAVIADKNTLANIDEYKSRMKKLADPRFIDEKEAQKIIDTAKPVYLITGGLHSTETGSPEMLMELAYRLIVSDSEKIKSIRENIITLIIPVLEVDGREKQVDWYYRHTINITDWDDKPPMSPPYWGRYTFHDNNREGIQISQPLTKQIYKVFFEYFPVVSLDLHESLPLLYISTGTGPYNPNIDPITITEFQLFAHYEVSELTKYGMPGAWTWGFFTGWYPGYLLFIPANHNTIGRFYETFGNAGANTFERKIKGKFAKKEVTSKQWYRPLPPPKKVKWSLRNNINYMETGVISGLYLASRNKELLLENFWKKGNNAIKKGKEEPPFAWLITDNEKKKDMVEYLVNQLHKHGIEVHRLNKKIKYQKKEYPGGTFVVRMDQPYGPFAKNLLEIQAFPKDAEHTSYDDVAWTLGLQYGVETVQIDEAFILNEPMAIVEFPFKAGVNFPKIKSPEYFVVPNHGSPNMISLRYAIKDFEVYAAEKSFTLKKNTLEPGTWIIPVKSNAPELRENLKKAAADLGLDVFAAGKKPGVSMHSLELPRIGVYHNWVYTQDSGWFRFAIEQYHLDYTLINDDIIRAGNLNDKFDVIIIPELHPFIDPKRILQGIDEKWSPLAYTKTEKYPSHGAIDETDDMTRGMGFDGVKHLDEFVISGGLLVTLGGGSNLAADLGLVPQVDRINPATVKVVNPGSFVKTKILQKESPITYGYKEKTHIFTGRCPLFEMSFKDRKYIVMQYGLTTAKEYPEKKEKEGDICLSGMIKNQEMLIHKPAILNIPRKSGRIVIFNFNPIYRYLNHHDFGFLFNTLMNWNDLPYKRLNNN